MTQTELEIIIAGEGGIKNVAKAIHEAHLKECIGLLEFIKKSDIDNFTGRWFITELHCLPKVMTESQIFELYEQSKNK